MTKGGNEGHSQYTILGIFHQRSSTIIQDITCKTSLITVTLTGVLMSSTISMKVVMAIGTVTVNKTL